MPSPPTPFIHQAIVPNGKRSLRDRSLFLDIARGSALECVAIQDILVATEGIDVKRHRDLKRTLHRIVSMLTRLIARSDVVAEPEVKYRVGIEHEYRDAEYEYKYEVREKPEPRILPLRRRDLIETTASLPIEIIVCRSFTRFPSMLVCPSLPSRHRFFGPSLRFVYCARR